MAKDCGFRCRVFRLRSCELRRYKQVSGTKKTEYRLLASGDWMLADHQQRVNSLNSQIV